MKCALFSVCFCVKMHPPIKIMYLKLYKKTLIFQILNTVLEISCILSL